MTEPDQSPKDSNRQQPDEATCILCGRCLAVCPLLEATGREELSPRAKKFLLQELGTGEQELETKDVQALAGLCLGCERCVAECPQGVDVPGALARLKARHPGWKGWIWKQVISRSGTVFPLLARWGDKVPGVLPEERLHQLRAMGQAHRLEPWIAVESFDTCGQGEKAVLFPGCTGRHARPVWTANAESLLHGVGFDVLEQPDWGCCGHTLGLAGLAGEQQAMQQGNLSLWRDLGRPRMVAFCATCLTGLTRVAQADLDWRDGERQQWLDAVTPLAALLGRTRFQVLDTVPHSVTLHRPCHSADWGTGFGPLADVIRKSGATVSEHTDCCGLGGSMQLEAPSLSRAVAGCFWDKLEAEKAQVLTACSGCVLQLSATAPEGVEVGHWLEVVAL